MHPAKTRTMHAVTEMESIIKPDEGQLLPRKILYLGTPHTETSIYLSWSESVVTQPLLACLLSKILNIMRAISIHRSSRSLGLALSGANGPGALQYEDILQRQASRRSKLRAAVPAQYAACRRRFPVRLGDIVVLDIDGRPCRKPSVVNSPDYRLQDLVCVGRARPPLACRIHQWLDRTRKRVSSRVDPAEAGMSWRGPYWRSMRATSRFWSQGFDAWHEDTVLEHLAKTAKWDVNYVIAEANMGRHVHCSAETAPAPAPSGDDRGGEAQHQKEHRLCDLLGRSFSSTVGDPVAGADDYRLLDEDPEHAIRGH